MRICLITEYFYPDNLGGGGPLLSNLVRSLKDTYSELEFDVITSNNLYRMSSENLASQEDWNGVNITRLKTPKPNGLPMPLRMLANLHFCSAALKMLKRRRYDLVMVATAPPTVPLVAHAYKRRTGTPYLYIIHDLEPDRAVTMGVAASSHPVMRAMKKYQHRWLHGAEKVAVLGRCMREHLLKNYDLPSVNVEVIPVGEDPEKVVPLGKYGEFRAKHNIDGFMALYGGNFGRYHNFDTILDAAKQLKARNEDVTFVLAGGGYQKEHIERRIAAEGIDNVRLFGFIPQDEYYKVLASTDVALVTLEPGMEGLCVPSKFYSIMASGRPTIALVSPRSEIGLVVEESGCGVQIEQGDTGKLVEALSELAAAPAKCARMGDMARSVLVERYSSREVARSYYKAIYAAVGKKAPESLLLHFAAAKSGDVAQPADDLARSA